ncbi:penicillin-binding protein (plasmid) [Citricoccus nitrophenolicus]
MYQQNPHRTGAGLDDLAGIFDHQESGGDPGYARKPDPAPVSARRRVITGVGALTAVAILTGLGIGAVAAPAGVAAAHAGDHAIAFWDSLPTEVPVAEALPRHTVMLDSAGKEFARLYSENRVDVKLGQMSEWFTRGLVATEDRRFYDHGGVDATGTARALLNNLASDSTQGASTLTQQLVQNIMIFNADTPEEKMVATGTSYEAKLREMKYAVSLEQEYTKDEILQMYANAVFFGNGAYGIQAAAVTYFNKDAADLAPHEAALLVGLLKNPTGYNPFQNPEAATDRRDTVLTLMHTNGVLDETQYREALAEDLGLNRGSLPSGCDDSDYPYYCALVRDEVLTSPAYGDTAEERADRLARGGMTITTGLDRQAIASAQSSVDEALGRDNRAKAGVALVEPGTGAVRAVVQNTDWSDTEVVYANRPFQSGSIYKAFVLATALEEGIPASTVLNTDGPYRPSGMASPDGGFDNYGRYDYGNIDGAEALERSTNVYFIRLIQKTGVRDVAAVSKRLGLHTIPQDLTGREASLALGAYETTPMAMAGAFATFAAGGTHCEPVAALKVVDSSTNEVLPAPDANCTQALSPVVADSMAALLRGPVYGEHGTLKALGGLEGGRDAAGKSGTSNASAANWTVGITGQLSGAVWLGDPRGGFKHPLDHVSAYGRSFSWVTGAEIAGPIWKHSMDGALKGAEQMALPETVNNTATSFDSTRRVPNLVGLPLPAALAAIESAGLESVISEQTSPGPAGTATGTVTSQEPAAGTVTSPGEELTVTLQEGSDTDVAIVETTD